MHCFLFGGDVMANEQNLIPMNERTESEQRAIATAGGKESGESRRKRKSLKEELLLMLEDEEVQKSVTIALINQAQKGNVKAYEMIRDTIEEKPVEKVQSTQTVIDMSKFSTEEIKAMLDDDIS
jgi:hypothetical protein